MKETARSADSSCIEMYSRDSARPYPVKEGDGAMAATIRDCMSRNACGRLVGRHVELATLRQVLTKGSPAIVHLHGMSGMGKSAILAAFAEEAREVGATVLAVEC